MPYIVLQEIEERKAFLAEMKALGKDKEYRAKIMTEISQVLVHGIYWNKEALGKATDCSYLETSYMGGIEQDQLMCMLAFPHRESGNLK